MNSGFNPLVVAPGRFRVQTMSDELQTPFFFGGSQVPSGLMMSKKSYSGSGMKGCSSCMSGGRVVHKRIPSVNRPTRLPFYK